MLVGHLAILEHQQAGHALVVQVVGKALGLAIQRVAHIGECVVGCRQRVRLGAVGAEDVAAVQAVGVAKTYHAGCLVPGEHVLGGGQHLVEGLRARLQPGHAARPPGVVGMRRAGHGGQHGQHGERSFYCWYRQHGRLLVWRGSTPCECRELAVDGKAQ
ncbi:hypothetical protein D3C76_1235710 [compost metagenome]